MDLSFTAEENAFRAEVRAFLATELPAHMRQNMLLGRRLRKEDLTELAEDPLSPWLGRGHVAEALRRGRLERGPAAHLR